MVEVAPSAPQPSGNPLGHSASKTKANGKLKDKAKNKKRKRQTEEEFVVVNEPKGIS